MTIGNTAKLQLNMAQVQTKYGDQLNQIYKTKYANRYESASKSLDELMNSRALKNKREIFREQFSNLYKNIYGIKDETSEDSSVSSAQSVKTSSASAGSAAEGMKQMANSLKYGGELDIDAYKSQAQGFVDSYNAMIEKLGKSDNQAVLQKGVLMVNTAKVYSSALNRAGITLGADNKLSVQDDLSEVSATDVKSTFGSYGFSDKVIQKAQQINQLSGGSGFFVPSISTGSSSSSSSSDKVNNPIAVKTAASDVEKAASSLKLYLKDIGADGSDKTFDSKEYADSAKKFVESYNKIVDEAGKSSSASVNSKGTAIKSIANAYKYALKRAGINVGADNKLTIADDIEKKTAADAKYAFGSGRFLDNVTQKAQQASALANSAREMGYNANSTYNYAYNSGALYSIYA